MIFFVELFQSIIFLLFPIILYLYFETIDNKKRNNLLFQITIVSSSLIYSLFIKNPYFIIFLNLPLFITYLKKEYGTYLLINFIIILYIILKLKISFYLILIQYISISVGLKFCKNKNNVFIIITTYFYTFLTLISQNIKFFNIEVLKIILIIIINYFLTSVITYLVFNNHNKYNELKEQYDSYLFKFIHEIKNPIAVCKGYIEIINNNKKIEVKKYLNIINQEIDESLDIMEEYLVLGRNKLNLDYMDLNLLLENIYDNYLIIAKENNINITLKSKEDELIILGDYIKLKQVMVNLIKNAMEAKKEETLLNIFIETFTKDNEIIVFIKDDGLGIKDMKKIGNNRYTTKKNGNGLGINLSNKIIELHKGRMNFESNTYGTKVTIFLPKVKM